MSESSLAQHHEGVLRGIGAGDTNAQIATRFGVSETSVRRYLRRHGIQRGTTQTGSNNEPGVELHGDLGTITSPILGGRKITDPDQLMLELGVNPEEWDIDTVRVNRWGAPEDPSYQLRLALKRKVPLHFVFPATDVAERIYTPVEPDGSVPWMTAVCGDQQAPWHDPHLHEKWIRFLRIVEPEEIVFLGDGMDLPSISRFVDNPEWTAPAQDCVQACFEIYAETREAAPHARIRKLIGNHDERIRTELLRRAERLYGLRPAHVAGEPPQEAALSVRRLLHLDRLNIELVEPNGSYKHAEASICAGLAVRHGWLTGKNSAIDSLKGIDYSLIVGHKHERVTVERTIHAEGGALRRQVAAQIGCMCQVKGGMGFAVDPNWQQGFATATVATDGRFNIEQAAFEDGKVSWRSERI